MSDLKTRNLVMVPISETFLAPTFTHDREVQIKVTKGLPEDAAYVGSTVDHRNMTAYFIFHHPSFPKHHEGSHIPIFHVEHEYTEVANGSTH